MAIFNVSPPDTNDPSYLGYSRPISDIAPNQSGKFALETIGEGISGVVGAVDTSIKKGIQNRAYEAVDKERDQYTEALESVKGQLDNGTIAPAVRTPTAGTGGATGATGASGSGVLDDDDDSEIPSGLASGLNRIQQLSAAKAAGSIKINDTQYAANVLSIAKQLRAQYGQGYREFIDDTVSKASGLPVANSYYQNLMLDINRQLSQLGKQKDDVGNIMTWGLKQGVPNMSVYMDQRRNNDPNYPGDSAILKKINDWKNLQAQQHIDAASRAESKDSRETIAYKEEQNLTRNLNQLVYHHINDNLQLSGLPSLRELLTYMEDVTSGRAKGATDAEVQQRVMQLTAYRNYIYQQGNAMAIGPAEYVGQKKAQDILEQSLTPIDTFIKLAGNKETGPAYFHLRQNQAIQEDDKNNWLVSKDRGAISRQLLTARGILGEQYFPEYLKSILANGQDKPFADLFSQEALNAVAPVSDERGQPINRTQQEAIQHAKKVGVPQQEYYGSMISWVEKMADPNLPNAAKDNIVKWAFSKPGVTDELKMDYRDPQTNQWVPGKYRALNIMSSDKVIQGVAESAKVHPENYTMLQNWTEKEFGKLYTTDLQNLNKIMEKNYLNVHFSYNDTTKQFGLVDNKNRPISYNPRALGVENPNAVYLNSMLDIVDNVNSGIQRIRSVYEHNPTGQGGNVDRYILQTLQTAGFRPGESVTGAPAEMAKALIKTVKPDATPEELNKLIFGGK